MAKQGWELTSGWELLAGVLVLIAGAGVATHALLGMQPAASNITHTSSRTQAAPNQSTSPTSDNSGPANTTPAAPVYTPSQLASTTQNSTTYKSVSPSYTVINFYGEYLSRDGWKITSETTLNGITTVHAQNNSQTTSAAISSTPDNGTTFTIQTP